MYIQFCDFYDILEHYVKKGSMFKGKNATKILFDYLFASYTTDHPVNLDSIRKMVGNGRQVKQEIKDYYEEAGVEQLASDILENVFPVLVSTRAFAEALYGTIQFDLDLKMILKSTGVRTIPEEDGMELALYVAEVLYVIMNRPHIPFGKDGTLDYPKWMSPKAGFRLISRRVPKPSTYFIGRNKELEKLHNQLGKEHEVFVWGVHGIGKSELAYQYCKEYKDTYDNILYVNSTGNLRENICTLQIIGAVPNTGDMFRDLVYCLRCLREDTLLVIDNLNTIAQHEDDWEVVRQCGCKLLVTTRCTELGTDATDYMELEEIKDMRSLISLVKAISGNKHLNTNILRVIINTMHKHTTAVVLLGMLLQKDCHTTGEILRTLNMRKLKSFFSDKLFFDNKKDSFYGHLRTLFHLFRFEETEREALQNMVLMPENGIPLKMFAKWMELENTDIIGGLIDQGMIQRENFNDDDCYQYLVSLKPIIRELASEELTPSFRTCAPLIRNTVHSMHLLMDSEADPYLLQISQEVIEWAKKDDIPVYIDYLHKSFELAVRWNNKTAMQKIADTLAYEVVETPYGTNVDKALMQDYQAALQEEPQRAIAFRKSAYSLLDLGQTEHKRLGAEIIDHIAGDYAEMNDWIMAKKYSDMSWAMFRELGMLGKPEIIPFACRRGSILSHVDNTKKGMDMLHQMENYLNNNEAHPTQNRVVLQTALSDAYRAMGDKDKSRKYMQEAKKSFDSLQSRIKNKL